MKSFHTKAIEAKADPNLEITGWLDREDLYDLYRRASLFVFPSTFEGFGMPILEAMAAGLPTICADARPMKDVSADGALHFPPGNAAALAEQMEKALTPPRPDRKRKTARRQLHLAENGQGGPASDGSKSTDRSALKDKLTPAQSPSGRRRALIHFFAEQADLSHDEPDALLPVAVRKGREVYFVVGAMLGIAHSPGRWEIP